MHERQAIWHAVRPWLLIPPMLCAILICLGVAGSIQVVGNVLAWLSPTRDDDATC